MTSRFLGQLKRRPVLQLLEQGLRFDEWPQDLVIGPLTPEYELDEQEYPTLPALPLPPVRVVDREPDINTRQKRPPRDAKELAKLEIRKIAERILRDPQYLATLLLRAQEGKLPPPIEALFWQYVAGKPSEEGTEGRAAKIVPAVRHVYSVVETPAGAA